MGLEEGKRVCVGACVCTGTSAEAVRTGVGGWWALNSPPPQASPLTSLPTPGLSFGRVSSGWKAC